MTASEIDYSMNNPVSLSGLTGLTFSAGTGTGDTTMTFNATLANINVALNGLTFTPNQDFNGTASIQIVSNDLGNYGSGGPQTATNTLNITVTAVNDPPYRRASSLRAKRSNPCRHAGKQWIASSLSLLAMTRKQSLTYDVSAAFTRPLALAKSI